MDVFFWRTLTRYRDRFLALLDMQGIPFDPMVNKYLEAEDIDKIQRNASGTSTNSGDNTRTTNATTTATDRGTATENGDSARLTSDSTTSAIGSTRTSATTNADNAGRAEAGNDGRTSTGTRLNDGSRSASRTAQGTSDETTAANGGYSDVTDGKDTTHSQSDGRTREAAKQAPMSASNVTSTQGDGKNTLTGGHIGDLDFAYASNYGQRDDGRISNDDTTHNVTTARTSQDQGSKHGATQDVASENGTESNRETTQLQDDATRSSATTDTKSGAMQTSDQGIETRNDDKSGKETMQDRRTSGHDNIANTTVTGSDGDKYFAQGTHTDKTTEDRVNRNRLTGRDGLTPQAGLMTAEDYLRRMGPAIGYLIDVLETCFIGMYDI